MDQKTIQRLINLRQNHGYSQEKLARELAVSRQAISNWERGEASPDTDNLIALARLYGVSLDELLGTETSPSELGLVETESVSTPAPPHRPLLGALHVGVLLVALLALGIGVAAITAWTKFPGGGASVPQHYEIAGEIIDSEPSYLGVQYVIRGAAWQGRETLGGEPQQLSLQDKNLPANTADPEELYTVFVSNKDTQFLSTRGKKIDNDFLSLQKGVSATFTLDVASDTLPALAKADTVRIYDAVGTSLGYVPECNTTI